MKFEELNLSQELLQAVQLLGFKEPTKIQELAIPKILSGENIIGQAPTGTGKTMAYLLPIFQRLDASSKNIQAVILSPTYELSMQTARTANDLADKSGLPLKAQGLIGGANISRQIDALKKKPQLIAGSAGRIMELYRKRKLHLHAVKFLVLDEFDRLLDKQHYNSVLEVFKLLPKDIQCMMFSATAPKKALEQSKIFGDLELIKVAADAAFAAERENLYKIVEFREKITEVRKLTHRFKIKRGLVFINRNFDAFVTLEKLRYDGIKAESLIGTSDKVKRKQAIADFKSGKAQLLLSTDLAARGLDIADIDYVINLNFPDNAQMYLHRAGRTARAGATGKVITLVDKKELYKLDELRKKLKIDFIKI